MIINFGTIIKVFRSNPYEYVKLKARIAGGTTDNDGNYIEPPKYTNLEINLNIQPARPSNTDIAFLANLKGRDLSGLVKIYSNEPLKTLSEINKTKGDKFVWNESVYEVYETSKYPSHHKSKAIRTLDNPSDFT